MQKFTIQIEETLSRVEEVTAKDEADAIAQIEARYYDSEIVLDSEDFDSVTFNSIT